MDADELRPLLEAAARELAAIANLLPESLGDAGDGRSWRAQILEARQAIDLASTTVPAKAVEVDEVLLEARALRADAFRSRDVAEAQHWALQDEHAGLLRELGRLTATQASNTQERLTAAEAAAAHEAALVAECADLQAKVVALRCDVRAGTQRLQSSTAFGHQLDLAGRKLRRNHDTVMMDNGVAQEILHIENSTNGLMRQVEEECTKNEAHIVDAKDLFLTRLNALKAEREEQERRYNEEIQGLETKLRELQEDYEQQWRAQEQYTRNKLSDKIQEAQRAKESVSEVFSSLDAEHQAEVLASREAIEKLEAAMKEELEAAQARLDGQLDGRRIEIQRILTAERSRCSAMREKFQQAAEAQKQEAARYKEYIKNLEEEYRNPSPRQDRRGAMRQSVRQSLAGLPYLSPAEAAQRRQTVKTARMMSILHEEEDD
eukprot:gnl/TRDRNA2_/TRDRNA2_184486_c0_seq1.p1 gnl/TRDRNA2_/TRDRNA2_184486_c0~~gnl/TRDRNA2_/TRDRNA2_184486_c0_seq1.p1  ORF type:complete len:434 (-),score=123.80 gnl/TRDRNA2_/TRDRNA2_184486_c0_seq1:21-1322(-)